MSAPLPPTHYLQTHIELKLQNLLQKIQELQRDQNINRQNANLSFKEHGSLVKTKMIEISAALTEFRKYLQLLKCNPEQARVSQT